MSKLSYNRFLEKLQSEHEYHLNGGTNYRQKTAELSLKLALATNNAGLFLAKIEQKN